MRYLISLTLLLVLNAFCVNVSGQVKFQQNFNMPVTPNVSALAKYVDVPVSKYTGVPSISIPIYTINQRGFELPVNISYHASGVTVSQEATSVGLGWVLNAGGVITRQINCIDDFLWDDPNYGFLNCAPFPLYFDDNGIRNQINQNELSDSDWKKFFTVVQNNTNNYIFPYIPSVVNFACNNVSQKLDTESDTYYYNFANFSGKFVVKNDGTVVKYSLDDGLKIDLIRKPSSPPYWTATDQNGIVYRFSDQESTTNKSTTYGSNSQIIGSGFGKHVSSWYLSEIIMPNRESILFTYYKRPGSETYIVNKNYKEYSDVLLMYQESVLGIAYKENGLGVIFNALNKIANVISSIFSSGDVIPPVMISDINQVESSNNCQYVNETTLHDEKYLQKIQWTSGQMNFAYSGREDRDYHSMMEPVWGGKALKLDAITVKGVNNIVVKTATFGNSYFNAQNSLSPTFDKLRLKLDNLVINDETYDFTYDRPDLLPLKTSTAYDHWGYYNERGTAGIPSLFLWSPIVENTYVDQPGADRSCNPLVQSIGVLTKIKYPTKGEVSFKYESHDFYLDIAKKNCVSGLLGLNDFFQSERLRVNNRNSIPPGKRIETPIEAHISIIWGPKLNSTDTWGGYGSVKFFNIIKHNIDGATTDIPIDAYFIHGRQAGVCEAVISLQPGDYTFVPYLSSTQYVEGNVDLVTLRNFTNTQKYIKGGGLRISEISSAANTRSFYYKSADGLLLSSGKLLNIPYYSRVSNERFCGLTVIQKRSSAFGSLSDSETGGVVGYSSVQEHTLCRPGEIVSKNDVDIIYNPEYSVVVSNFNNSSQMQGDLPNNLTRGNGWLNDEKYLDAVGRIVMQKVYMPNYAYFTPQYYARVDIGGAGISGIRYYTIQPYWKAKTSETTTEYFYDVNGAQSSTTNVVKFGYNTSNRLVNSVKSKNSQDEEEESTTTYPNDYSSVSPYKQMIDMNIVSKPIETIHLKNGKVTEANLTTYISRPTSQYFPAYLPENVYQADLPQPVESANFYRYNGSSLSLNSYSKKLSYDAYDDFDNVLQFTPISGIPTSIVYGYNNTLPIKKYENATLAQVKAFEDSKVSYYIDFENGISGGWSASNPALLTNGSFCVGKHEVTFPNNSFYSLYSPKLPEGNYDIEFIATSPYGPGWISVAGNLGCANVQLDNVCKTFVVKHSPATNGGFTFSGLTSTVFIDNIRISPAGVVPLPFTTYTYDPLVGMTSQTDPNGIATYYEYDTFGRLFRIIDRNGKVVKEMKYNYAHE